VDSTCEGAPHEAKEGLIQKNGCVMFDSVSKSKGVLAPLILCSFLCMTTQGSLARADDVELGHDLYHELCAGCHGQEMMHPGLAFDLKKFPLNDPERFKNSVLNGKPPAMPAWRSQLSEDDVRLLWAYVKSGG